jgi:invasion protein IalB
MTRFYCENMRCASWEECTPMRGADEGNCTLNEVQITKEGKCENVNMIYTDKVKRYRIIDKDAPFTVLIDKGAVVKAPDDRLYIIGWSFKELAGFCKLRKASIEEIK